MSTPFQNRLVGTVIVAAMAIIFLPDLLDGEKQTYQEAFEKIPQAPTVNFTRETKDFPTEKLDKLPKDKIVNELAIDDDVLPEENKLQTKPDEKLTTDNNTSTSAKHKLTDKQINTDKTTSLGSNAKVIKALPEKAKANTAWVIQLGSFRHKNNVDELVKKLEKAGYTVFTKPIKTKTGTLTKVFVGPELIKTSLEKKIPKLKQLTKVQGKVARFSPVK